MLNPLAHDYTPLSTILPPEDNHKAKGNRPSRQRDQQVKKSSSHPQKSSNNKKQVQSKPSQTVVESKSEKSHKPEKTNTSKANKRRDSQANPNFKKQQEKSSKRHPRISQQASQLDLFAQESKFITIEAAIDPVYRVEPQSFQSSSGSRRQSSGNLYQFEHGYERYVDWIDRSLHVFDTVTVVGMDNAIVDIVSIVTILQEREIGIHDTVETFSMETGNGKLTSCIQVKLHPFLYHPAL
ncbi:hypothetical protein BD560DRAFT_394935 [Blakeslea trispora]|nr:hypothetical protein BD560DRAFT_394935 [Blakeslea trispora]